MKKRTIFMIVLLMLACSFNAFAGTTEQNVNKAEFLVKAFKNTKSGPVQPKPEDKPGTDSTPTVSIVDSLDVRLGQNSRLSADFNSISYIPMGQFMDEFFADGIHVAMITVSSITVFGTPGDSTSPSPSIPPIKNEPNAANTEGALYAPHVQKLTIKATPITVVTHEAKPDTPPLPPTEADANSSFSSTNGGNYPVTIFIRTSKVSAKSGDAYKNRPIIKSPSDGTNTDEWYGKASRLANILVDPKNNTYEQKAIPYKEYTLKSTYTDSVGGSMSGATLDLEFSNNTVRQEYNGSNYDWITYKDNIGWTAENQVWIKGDRAKFDTLNPGLYRMILKISIITN